MASFAQVEAPAEEAEGEEGDGEGGGEEEDEGEDEGREDNSDNDNRSGDSMDVSGGVGENGKEAGSGDDVMLPEGAALFGQRPADR